MPLAPCPRERRLPTMSCHKRNLVVIFLFTAAGLGSSLSPRGGLAGSDRSQADEPRKQDADRAASVKNLKQIAQAMEEYLKAFAKLPAAAVYDKYDKDGKPTVSWRVMVLPFLGDAEKSIYDAIDTREPWDGPNNKKLLDKMPKVFAPVGVKTKEPHSTFYCVFAGPGTAFDGKFPLRLADITDGAANTILVV